MPKEYLDHIAIFISFLPLVLCYRQWRNLIWLSAAISFLNNVLLVFVLGSVYQKSIAANIYVWVDFLLLFAIYKGYRLFSFYPFIRYLSLLVFILEIVHTVFLNGQAGAIANLGKFNGTGLACLSFVYIVFSLCGYMMILKLQERKLVSRPSFFWFNTAVFVYSSGGFMLFLFIKYLVSHNMVQEIATLWPINNGLDMIRSILFIVALFKYKKETGHPGQIARI